jgi:hypothetical protein
MLFDAVLPLRLPAAPTAANGSVTLRPMVDRDGFFGDPADHTITPVAESKAPAKPVACLPNACLARAWLAVVTGKPFEEPPRSGPETIGRSRR